MLKFQQAINMGIASILVIPAIALQGEQSKSLEEALENTISALDHLVRVRDEKDVADPTTRAMIVAATEPAMAAGPQRDQYLNDLRRDVSVLAMELESVENKRAPREMIQGSHQEPTASFNANGGSAQRTTGLSDQDRQDLSNIQAPLPGVKQSDPKVTLQIEEDGFVVDPILLGRSYYRGGRFLEGAELLANQSDSAEGLYWYGRCLEKLDRFDEAIEAYSAVLEKSESSYLADRARNDREFLTWKREFQSKINDSKQDN